MFTVQPVSLPAPLLRATFSNRLYYDNLSGLGVSCASDLRVNAPPPRPPPVPVATRGLPMPPDASFHGESDLGEQRRSVR